VSVAASSVISVARNERLTLLLSASTIAGVAGVAFIWRVLSWAPAVRVDGWAYAAWGQALARAERPLFDLGATTPKPLAAILGFLAAPLPPARAFAIVAALALAVLAASLFAAAFREAGAVAGAISVVAFVAGARLNLVLAFGYIDAVVAAFVVAGIALRGRWRIAALVLAGLLRPEAWILAAIAGFSETVGSLRRRVAGAVIAGVFAPALWVVADLVLIGDPLGTMHWQSQRRRETGSPNVPWTDVPGDFWSALNDQGSIVLVLVGLLGLGLQYARTRRRGSGDVLPLAVVVVWSPLIALQVLYGGVNPRYLLPVVAVLALGCGLLAAHVLPSRFAVESPWPGVGVAVIAVVLAAVTIGLAADVRERIARNEALAATRPAVDAVLSCGRLGVTPRVSARDLIPQLAASSRRSLHEFGIYRSQNRERFAAVLQSTRRPRPVNQELPPWLRDETPLGPLVIRPGCQAIEELDTPG
jgi:hypothetical protein